jgi:FkbM family methyltransferase
VRSFRKIPHERNSDRLFQDLLETASFILRHPLNDTVGCKAGTFLRYLSWQIRSRLHPAPSLIDFVGHTRLLIKRGVAQRRICYMPLNEFEEMAFVVHVLRQGDLFVDVGANIGAYSVLAGPVAGAAVLACEPLPASYALLRDNIRLNRAGDRVQALNVGVGGAEGTLTFTSSFGPKDHVVTALEALEIGKKIDLPVRTLDSIVGHRNPTMIKIDVEGFETEAIKGGEKVLKKASLRAIVIELKGHGARYGYDESVLMDRIAGFGFQASCYSPLGRRIFTSDTARTRSDNRIYIRDPDWARERVASHPGFRFRNRTL